MCSWAFHRPWFEFCEMFVAGGCCQACGDAKEDESCDGVCTDCEYQDGHMHCMHCMHCIAILWWIAVLFTMVAEDWSAWQDCPVTCGGGKQNRTRDVAVPATNGGKECVGILGSSNHSFNTCIATTGLVFLFDVRTSLFDS